MLTERSWLPNWSFRRWPWLEEGAVNRRGRTAIDEVRIQTLKNAGYDVAREEIDRQISEMNRVIVAQPLQQQG